LRALIEETEKGLTVPAHFHCPSRRISRPLDFLIDTGSSRSFLSWTDAKEMGVEIDHLPTHPKPVRGFGGGTSVKHLKDPCFVYLEFDRIPKPVDFPDGILVYEPSKQRSLQGQKLGPGPSILGRDLMRRSGWTLHVNLQKGERWFEG